MIKNVVIALAFGFFCQSKLISAASEKPDPQLTPGTLCTADDPNFDGYYYAEKIPHCKRNVSTKEKSQVAANYGNIPKSEWANYEFDHLYPLCAGGSDDISNIWPQPRNSTDGQDSLSKDKIEDRVCAAMRAGTMTQAEAIQQIDDWFQASITANEEAL